MNDIIKFNEHLLLEEQGSGDLPACSCNRKKKRKNKKIRKMKWSSDFMAENFEEEEVKVYERCGVCGGIKKKKKKVKKPIKLQID